MAVDEGAAVLEERDGAVFVLTLNRPDRLNALSRPVRHGLQAALERAMADDAVGAIVLTGAGRAFSAGGDLDEITGLDDVGEELRSGFNPIALLLVEGPKPVVAAINGPTAGAALGLALACDLRVMAEDAVLAVAFAGIGLVPDTGVSWTLPRLVGPARAYDLAVTGRRVVAEEAGRIGLADRIVPRDELLREARELAAQLASGPRAALAETKRLLREAQTRSLTEALQAEADAQAAAAGRPEFAEGVAAFRERRPPRFT
jgi:2-(1,2-epoxy-1,2-dihydrophenyl)acetyl-CoA isomerase